MKFDRRSLLITIASLPLAGSAVPDLAVEAPGLVETSFCQSLFSVRDHLLPGLYALCHEAPIEATLEADICADILWLKAARTDCERRASYAITRQSIEDDNYKTPYRIAVYKMRDLLLAADTPEVFRL